ncbi:MAG: DNA mismatch repair protein MutS [Verrucomicrobia bacterium]|nr:DNA mismatch repair protein MutS [Verrucomicrobiota bacterium]
MAEGSTPMMKQYQGLRAQVPKDALLFFRLGDFYELFFQDAVEGARLLNLTLTKRNTVPMCGLPYHAAEGYIAKVLASGRRVALCDQVGEVRSGQMVERAITRILSPGCAMGMEVTEPKLPRWLAAVRRGEGKSGRWGFALLDASSGDFRVSEPADEIACREEVRRTNPAEILVVEEEKEIPSWVDSSTSVTRIPDWTLEVDMGRTLLCEHYQVQSLDGFGCKGMGPALGAAGALLRYIRETLKGEIRHCQAPKPFRSEEILQLDFATQRNLEILESASQGVNTSLLRALDQTCTPMGGRELRSWLLRPLRKRDEVVARHEAVAGFLEDVGGMDDVRESLQEVRDIARLVGRLAGGSGTARDLVALRATLQALPELQKRGQKVSGALNRCFSDQIQLERALVEELERGIADDPPATTREGGMIRDGYDRQLDEARSAMREGRSWIAELQAREAERTGIKSLKIRFQQVSGYGIEVTKANLDQVPKEYERKQTLAQVERYVTPELKEMEAKILGAEEKALHREGQLFLQIRDQVLARTRSLQETAAAIGSLDVLAGFAVTARRWHYVRPVMTVERCIRIRAGRHPVVEQILAGSAEPFVANDLRIGGKEGTLMVLTGPNMAGKSTYLRQAALICFMAQVGSFVPVQAAELPLLDRIFTRIGAGDDLARGQSTFLVEMNETALILHHATRDSLVILDEIGRGTSTLDGLSIAWAVGEHLHDEVQAKTLFATHYHELAELALTRSGVMNFRVDVREEKDRVVFLRRIVEGGADRSYGIQVARLAGLPPSVLRRAGEILQGLEERETDASGKPARIQPKGAASKVQKERNQLDLFQG